MLYGTYTHFEVVLLSLQSTLNFPGEVEKYRALMVREVGVKSITSAVSNLNLSLMPADEVMSTRPSRIGVLLCVSDFSERSTQI